MNKSYKIIFNHHTCVWVVVSELVSSHGKRGKGILDKLNISCDLRAGSVFASGLALSSLLGLGFVPETSWALGLTGGTGVQAPDASGTSTSGAVGTGAISSSAQGTVIAPQDDCIAFSSSRLTSTGANVTFMKGLSSQSTQMSAETGSHNGLALTIAGDNGSTSGEAAQTATSAFGFNSMASGCGSRAFGAGSTAIGANNTARLAGSVAMGIANTASGAGSSAFGIYATASGYGTIAMGIGATASGDNSIALGTGGDGTAANTTQATTTGAIAIGGNATKGAQATGTNAIAIGGESSAADTSAIAIGRGAVANSVTNNGDQLAIGDGAQATGTDSTAIGGQTTASGQSSVVIGGNGASGTNTGVVVLGYGSNASGIRATALGSLSTATGDNSVAISNGANSAGANAIAIGAASATTVAGDSSVAVGRNTNVSAQNGVAVGTASTVSATNGMALGPSASVQLANSVALGSGSTAIATTATTNWIAADGVVLGKAFTVNQAPTNGVVAVGNRQIQGVADGEVSATSTNAINGSQLFAVAKALPASPMDYRNVNSSDIGNKSSNSGAAGAESIAIGGGASANAIRSTATGYQAKAQAVDAIAIGSTSLALANESLAIGKNAVAEMTTGSDKGGVSIGSSAYVNSSGGVALGQGSQATVAGGAVGYAPTKANATDKAAITATNSTNLGAVSVGTGSVGGNRQIVNVAAGTKDSDAVNVAQLKSLANTSINFTPDSGATVSRALGDTLKITSGTATGTATTNLLTKTNAAGDGIEISFKETPTFKGADMSGQKITNVGAGSLASGSTDAVNGGQLNTAIGSVATKLGGGTSFDPATGQVVGGFTVGSTTYATVGDAISGVANTPMTFTGNSGSTTRKLGETLTISGGATGTTSNSNIKTVVSGSTVDIQLANAPVFTGQVKANGFDANGQKIINVAPGSLASGSTDAVNGGQLNTAVGSVATKLGGGTSFDPATGQIIGGFTVGSTTYATVGDAISGVANTPMTFTGNTGSATRKLGETLTISGGATGATSNSNIKTVVSGSTVDIQLANAPVFTGQVKANGFDAGGQKIVNVAPGSLASGSTDAVNGGQLNTAIGSVATKLGGGTSFDPATGQITGGFTTGGKTYATVGDAISGVADTPMSFIGDSGAKVDRKLGETLKITSGTATGTATTNLLTKTNAAGDGIEISFKETPTFKGADMSGQKIANVGAGSLASGSTDAVNGGQLNTALGSVATKLGGGTSFDPATGQITGGFTAGGKTYATVGDAISGVADTPMSFIGDSGTKVDRKLGETLKITSGTATGTATTNLLTKTNAAGDGIEISFKETPTFKGADMSGQKITNVGAGSLASGSTDAVNGGQLNTALGSVATKLGGGTSFDPATGQVVGGFTVGGTTYANVADAIAGASSGIVNTPMSFIGDSGTKVDRKLGETLKITSGTATGTATTNLLTKTNTAGDGIEISFKETPTFKGADMSGQKITNVGAGSLASGSTDAVNGGQLNTALGSVATKLGGGTSFDPATGQITGGFTAGGKTYATVGDAISGIADTPLTFAGNSGSTTRKLGETLTISGGATGATSNSNIKTVVTGSTVDIQLADAPVFAGQVKANGFDASGQKIINVAPGSVASGSTDAVNGSQLNTAVGSVATKLGGGTSFDPTTGQITGGFTAGGKTYATVGDAISGVADTPMSFIGDTGAKVDRKLGETLKITSGTATGTATTNLLTKTNAAGDGIEISFKETPTFKGADMSGQKITNVGVGSLASGSTDAVNGGQLNTALGSVTTKLGGGTSFDPATGQITGGFTAAGKTYATVGDAISGVADTPLTFAGNSGSTTRKLGETLTISGGATGATSNSNIKTVVSGSTVDIQLADAPVFAGQVKANGFDSNGQKIVNVGAGTATTDAVNIGQLTTTLGGNVTYNADGSLKTGYEVGGKTYANVADAIAGTASGITNTPMSFIGDSGAKVDRKLGETLKITSGTATGTTTTNLLTKTNAAGDGIEISFKETPTFKGADMSGQKITNVGAGSLASGSTDAVNGGQFNTAIGSVATKLGGGTSFDPATGQITGGFTAGGKTYATVGDAISGVADTPLTFAGNSGSTTRKLGETLTISGGATGATSNSNIKTVVSGSTVDIQLADAPVFAGQVKANGFDANGQKIVNLGAGTATTDAVNVGQLTTTLGGNVSYNADGTLKTGFTTNSGTYGSVAEAINAVNTTASKGWNLSTNGGTSSNVAPGATVDIAAGSSNVIVSNVGTNVKVDIAQDLNLNSVKTGNTTIDGTGVAVGSNVKLGNTGLIIAGGPSVTATGIDAGNKAITNVAAGTSGTDAVNVAQLNKTVSDAVAAAKTKYYSVNSSGGGNLNNDGATGADAIASGKDALASQENAVAIGKGATATTKNSVALGAASATSDVVATSKTTLGGKDYQYAGTAPVGTVSVGDVNSERTITNVAAGRVSANSTDAINGSQLYVVQKVLTPLLDVGGSGQTGLLPPSAGGLDPTAPGQLLTQTAAFNNTSTSSVKASDCQTVAGVDSTGMGLCVKANQKGTTALGSNAQATAENATALGFRSTASGEKAVAVGYQNTAAKESVAVGSNNTVTGEKSIAIGVGNTVAGNRSIVIGDPTNFGAGTDDSVSVGNNNTFVTANQSVALGSNTVNLATQTVAIGQGAQATQANSVALGASSVTGDYQRTQSITIGGRSFAFAGSGAGLSTVSIGSAGNERQLQNVAAARISATSTDAVNGSQLYATNQAIETLQAGIGGVYETLNYLDGRITNVARDANAGSASAMAMASMPQAWEPNKTITSMGMASYQGESAYSMGVSRMSDNGRVVINFGATGNTRNKFGMGVGVGIQW